MPDVRLEFSTDLYAVSAVHNSVEAFEGFATFAVEVDERATVVTLSETEGDADVVANEFANFVLNETILVARAPNVEVSA